MEKQWGKIGQGGKVESGECPRVEGTPMQITGPVIP